ncbi:MAG TPA: lipoyl(octanoyl) transferase, partial [Planctomycetota bacterium]|nr:lipoyl(octanoyl) transferase [Planctomycetota bacterium]
GLCFNVAADMPVYRHIIPCGQADRGVTNLATLTGRTDTAVLMAEAATVLLAEFAAVFEADLHRE